MSPLPIDLIFDSDHPMDSKTLDNSTQASLPGECRITRSGYARYFGRSLYGRAWRYFSSFLPFAWQRIPLLDGGYQWIRMKERFLYGDTNPTIVVDPKRRLVATYTNLDSQWQYRFPVIRVISDNLQLIRGGVHEGQRFASISTYRASPDSERLGRWATFVPIVLDCISADQALCESTKAKIPPREWEALEFGLRQLPRPFASGLYDIVLPDELRQPA